VLLIVKSRLREVSAGTYALGYEGKKDHDFVV
jgi:hypothetical protein